MKRVQMNIVRKGELLKKGAMQEERERESVRRYWVQLAELFHLVGLPNSVCGTSDSEIDRGKNVGMGGLGVMEGASEGRQHTRNCPCSPSACSCLPVSFVVLTFSWVTILEKKNKKLQQNRDGGEKRKGRLDERWARAAEEKTKSQEK